MGFKYKDLSKRTKSATIDLGDGDELHFSFRAGLVTPQFLADMQALDDGSEVTPGHLLKVSDHLARLLVSWDLEDDDGGMFPIDASRFAMDLPLELQLGLLTACIEEMKPGEATAAVEQAHA